MAAIGDMRTTPPQVEAASRIPESGAQKEEMRPVFPLLLHAGTNHSAAPWIGDVSKSDARILVSDSIRFSLRFPMCVGQDQTRPIHNVPKMGAAVIALRPS